MRPTTWSRFDDGYDEHDKVDAAWDMDRATIGLHVMATTACNRWLSDGVIKPRWLLSKLPDRKERTRVLAALVAHELLELLPAGETRELVDSEGNVIEVGPHAEDRYVVHDFLDRHDSSVQVKDRRRRDAERKRRTRRQDSPPSPRAVQSDATRTLRGHAADSNGSPLTRGSAPTRPHPDPTRPDPKTPQPPDGGSNEPAIPIKPNGGRARERAAFELQVREYAAARFPDVPDPQRTHLVIAAIGRECSSHAEVESYVRRWADDEGRAA